MQTPFGDIPVADAHAHFFSYRFFETLAAGLKDPPNADRLFERLGERLPFDFPEREPESFGRRWVEELRRQSVDQMVIIASVPGDEESVARAANAHPDHLIPYFMLNPKSPDAQERARRAFNELGIRGLCLFPAMHHFYVWDDALSPILEMVADVNGIVFVHCGVLKVGIRNQLGLQSPFDIRFASPLELSGVASRYPSVPFVLPHFGSGMFRELLMLADQCPNVYTDTSSSNAWVQLLPEPMTLEQVFLRTLSVMGAERVLYGSDSSFFPRGWLRSHFDAQVEILGKLGIAREDAALILGGNLNRLVGV